MSETRVAKSDDGESVLARKFAWLKTGSDGMRTSLDINSKEGRFALVNAIQGECKSMDEVINSRIVIKDVLVHDAETLDADTGEVKQFTRTVLILDDGSQVSAGSAGVIKSLQLAAIMFGPPPWLNAACWVKQQKIGDNRRWYVLDWELKECEKQTSKPAKNTGKGGKSNDSQ